MVSCLGRYAVFAVVMSGFSSATHALTENPVDPSLPLTIHAFTTCNFVTPVNRNELASCLAQRSVENPTTLHSVTGTGAATADLRRIGRSITGASNACSIASGRLRRTWM